MCCFSQPAELLRVADTNIFARSNNDRQFLVYSMSYAASSELAMILPLPVPPHTSEDAVRFIDLHRYPTFFDDMRRGFIYQHDRGRHKGPTTISLVAPKLRVHSVGDFEASFVPRIGDFNRLDERFRIAPDVWDKLPEYHNYGFAVFKLKASFSRGVAGAMGKLFGGGVPKLRRVHPMAFTFPRRNPELLYFPTVHVHDGEVHWYADFDHNLFCQPDAGMEKYLRKWEIQMWGRSTKVASEFMNIARSEGIIDSDQYCWSHSIKGLRPNKDTLVGEGAMLPL
jgi:hypothetical protein